MAREHLEQIAEKLQRQEPVESITVRQLLKWYDSERRGSAIVRWIRSELNELGLETVPDFNDVWLDARVTFCLVEPNTSALGPPEGSTTADDEISFLTFDDDPTYRIQRLDAANQPPLFVTPNTTLQQATTMMLAEGNDYAVVRTGDRTVKGVVSWRSIGRKLALAQQCTTVADCMDNPVLVRGDSSLFAVLPLIVENGYAIVRDTTDLPTGMVTTRSLSESFRDLAEPFLLLGEIENHLRSIIARGRFTVAELQQARDPGDQDRLVQSIADLSFGEYVRMVGDPLRWERLELPIDRSTLVESLEAVRKIRNDVMHFDPDPLGSEALVRLRKLVRFLRELVEVGVVGPLPAAEGPA